MNSVQIWTAVPEEISRVPLFCFPIWALITKKAIQNIFPWTRCFVPFIVLRIRPCLSIKHTVFLFMHFKVICFQNDRTDFFGNWVFSNGRKLFVIRVPRFRKLAYETRINFYDKFSECKYISKFKSSFNIFWKTTCLFSSITFHSAFAGLRSARSIPFELSKKTPLTEKSKNCFNVW